MISLNIYLHELKVYRKSTILWTLTLVLFLVGFMSMYPSFTNDVDGVKNLLNGFPEPIQKAIGLEIDQFFSVLGFFSYIFLYIKLCGAIQAMNIGIAIISKEVRDKTADFLLTKPVSRVRVLTAKLLAVLTSIVFTNVLFAICAYFFISSIATEPFSSRAFWMIASSLFFIQFIFLVLGITVGVVAKKIKTVLPLTLGIVFTFFIINMFGSASGDTLLRFLTPFQYVEPLFIARNETFEMPFILTGLLISTVCIASSYLIYIKKDIQSL